MEVKMGVIRIEQGNEFKVINNAVMEDDLFLKQYQLAAEHVEEIVSASDKSIKAKECSNEFFSSVEISVPAADHLNNIIAFTGDRGQGKSSAMEIFTDALKNKNNEIIKFGEKTRLTNFLKLETIDPSTFENIHNIVEVVVAKMFNIIKDQLEKSPGGSRNYRIFDKFQKVYECLSLIRNPRLLEKLEYDYEGSIQKIAHIGDSTMLKKHMYELVSEYLSLMGKTHMQNFLVIPMDDLDINIELAYKMSEQIRKYLLIPNVIIVMAIKIEQLKYCVELQYRKELDILIKSDCRINKQEPISMAAKYIEKLIPDGRKISLPQIKVIASNNEDKTIIEYIRTDGGSKQRDLLEKYRELGVERTILGYIYEKTGLVFVKPANQVHPLIPNTLRELVNLLSVLGKMGEGKSIDNLTAFENYMLNTWIPGNLDDGYIRIINGFYQGYDFAVHSLLCPMLLNILEKYENYTLQIKEDKEFDELKLRFFRKAENQYTLGDVLSLLAFINYRYYDSEMKMFVFAVKTLYSIIMNKMALEDRHTDKDKPKDLFRFVNGDIWGYTIEKSKSRENQAVAQGYSFSQQRTQYLIPKSDETKEYRALFTYEVDRLFGNKLSETNKIANEKLTQEQIDTICYMLFFSNFKPNSFVSDNSIYRKNANFNIENFLVSSLDLGNLKNKWGFNADARIDNSINALKQSLNYKTLTEIVASIELCEYVFNYCYDNRFIKVGAVDSDHITRFIQNIEKAIKSKTLNYLFVNQSLKIINDENFISKIVLFYNNCFNTVLSSDKPGNDVSKKDIDKLKAELMDIDKIYRVCSPNTLINRIDSIIKLISTTKNIKLFKSGLTQKLYDLEVLKKQCNNHQELFIDAKMKEKYNDTLVAIIDLLDEDGE
jgi:energy-coupling factor transporter ATP-binding protein EcfA2